MAALRFGYGQTGTRVAPAEQELRLSEGALIGVASQHPAVCAILRSRPARADLRRREALLCTLSPSLLSSTLSLFSPLPALRRRSLSPAALLCLAPPAPSRWTLLVLVWMLSWWTPPGGRALRRRRRRRGGGEMRAVPRRRRETLSVVELAPAGQEPPWRWCSALRREARLLAAAVALALLLAPVASLWEMLGVALLDVFAPGAQTASCEGLPLDDRAVSLMISLVLAVSSSQVGFAIASVQANPRAAAVAPHSVIVGAIASALALQLSAVVVPEEGLHYNLKTVAGITYG